MLCNIYNTYTLYIYTVVITSQGPCLCSRRADQLVVMLQVQGMQPMMQLTQSSRKGDKLGAQ